MNRLIAAFLLSATLVSSAAQASLLDWFRGSASAQFQQLTPDTAIIGHLTGTKVSVAGLEKRLAALDPKVPVTLDEKEEDGTAKKATFTPVKDGIFIMKWRKKGVDSLATRVLDKRDEAENLLPHLSEIVEPYQKNFKVYYGSPEHKRMRALRKAAA